MKDDAERLLAAFLRSRRKAREILERTTLRHLSEASVPELERLMPRDAAERFASGMRLARLILTPLRGNALDDKVAAACHLHPYLAGRETERFVVVACDAKCRPISTTVVAEGSASAVAVSPADVFAPAFRHRAAAVILGHNHPSGDPTPSGDDVLLTQRLVEAGRLLGVQVIDHLVVCGDRAASALHGGSWPLPPDAPAP